jgi:trehalose 6-phosphate phosphatase
VSGRGRLALEALCRDPGGAGLVLDFDDVLSPIVTDPTTSRMPDGTAILLERIARHLRFVGLMSGRQLNFLVERATIRGVNLLGSYGVEVLQRGERHVHPGVGEWLEPVRRARSQLESEFADLPGVVVDDKHVAVAVHWRQAGDFEAVLPVVRAKLSDVAASTGLRREPGKLVEELRPPLSVDKGTALAGLVEDEALRVVAYGGDDVGDISAFEAVLRTGGHALLVDHGSETDDRLRALATEVFDGVDDFATWLRDLATRLEGEGASSI